MSVFLTLPLLSFLSFQSIPTIDWCSFPSITTYFGDLIDLGMNVAPKVTCCAVTSLGFFVLALLAFLGYYASRFGCGPLQLPTIVLKPVSQSNLIPETLSERLRYVHSLSFLSTQSARMPRWVTSRSVTAKQQRSSKITLYRRSSR